MCACMSLVPFVVPITVIQFYSYGMVSSLFSDGCMIFFVFGLIIWAWTALCIGSIKYVWICSHCCTICNNSCSRYYVLSANSVELLRVSFSICVTYSVEWHFVPLCSVFWYISYEEWPPRLGSLFYSRVQRLKSALESSIKNLLLFNSDQLYNHSAYLLH